MSDPDELTKDDIIEALSKDNARLSKLLAIAEYQKDHIKTQCSELRKALTEEMSKNNS
jgi:chaperonin cofactor prefoldin